MEQRGVGDRARQHAVHRQAVPGARARRERHAAALGLEPEQPAPRRRDADRAGAVGAERGADQTGGDRRRAAAAGAAGRALESHGLRVAPNVAVSVNGHSVSSGTFVLPITTAPASRRRRTTSASARAGPPWALVPARGHLAGDVDVVLDRDRHAQQRALAAGRAARVGLVGFQQRALGEHDPEGVQQRVVARDALEVELDELARGDLAGGDQLAPGGRFRRRRARRRPSAGNLLKSMALRRARTYDQR